MFSLLLGDHLLNRKPDKSRFPKLYEDVLSLWQQGIYSIYSVANEEFFVLRVPGKTRCCGGFNRDTKYYKIDLDGNVLEEMGTACPYELKEAL